MSRKTTGQNKPVADIAMTRGYLVVVYVYRYPESEEYTFLAENGGSTDRTEDAKWFGTVEEAIDEIYKLNIKPSYTNGVICPKVVLASDRLIIERVAFECAINDGKGGAE